MIQVIVKSGHVLPLWKGHPWVFNESIKQIQGVPKAGEVVDVFDEKQNFIGRGWYSPASQIRVRLLTRKEEEEVATPEFFKQRIQSAVYLRKSILQLDAQSNSYRVIHSEGDRLPGLVADWYDGILVVRISTIGMYQNVELLRTLFKKILEPRAIFFFYDAYLKKEGLPDFPEVTTDQQVVIQENGCSYQTQIGFQKTGFYLDQRANRRTFREIAFGKVLDAFCFCGGFGINALKGRGESVTFVDSSAQAITQTKQNLDRNELVGECIQDDIHRLMNAWKAQGRTFHTICLDPPKFVAQKAHLKQGLKKYQAINQLAFSILEPKGLLFTFSCSGGVEEEEFLRMVNTSAIAAKREIQILKRLSQGDDHPFLPACPQSIYLNGLVVLVY